jgi:hypothetical protein
MESEALAIASKFWQAECRDDQLMKMKKQKKTAQSQLYSLKKQLKETELAHSMLLGVYINTVRENTLLHSTIGKFIEAYSS